ncbi:MAG: hypothetical protein WCR55_03210 [Lentisphaerota bacterium]
MQGNLISIYEKLYSKFGPQKWWPSTLEGELIPSYHGQEPNNKMRFEVAVGAILTQNTTWTNVIKAIANLNRSRLMSPENIFLADRDSLCNEIRSSGYYNQKYKKLISLSEWWKENFTDIKIGSRDSSYLETIRNSLLSINGIGPETADSILLYAFDMPSFVIDTYTKRVLARHYGIDSNIKYDSLHSMFMKELPNETILFKEYHALFVALGKHLCRKSVCLENCPLK